MKTSQQENQIIKQYQRPFSFYLLCTAIPWTFWFVSGYLSHREPFTKTVEWATGITSIAGLLAPAVVALFFMLSNKELKSDFLGRIFNFRKIKPEYILITCFLMLISILSAQVISLIFGYPSEQFSLRGSFTFSSSLFPVWFLLLAAPVLEELAWHSYGTDSLVSRFNLLNASLIFAIFWGLWHLPLSTIKGYYHSNLVESGLIYSINFLVSMIPFVLIMNWIYYKTNRNILLPIVFHITAVFFNEIFATHPMSKVIQTGLLLMISVYLVLNDKELFLKKKYLVMLAIPCLFGCTKVDPLFEDAIPYENQSYNEETISNLPGPVQRYFRYALVDGQNYINYLRLKHSGTFKTAKDREWMDIQGEQYFIANPPGFLWIGKTNSFKARDSYIQGEGNLSVYLFGLLRIVKEEGHEVNQAELLRWLGESVWMPTNFLPDENKTWSAIDENSAMLTFTYNGITVYYNITFDETGRMISLETERYMEDSLVPWKGEVGNYILQDGMMVPTDIEASWRMEDGKYTYARFHVDEFEYGKAEKY